MRQPHSLQEAKQIFQEEKAKVTGGVSSVIGSRGLIALLAALTVGYGAHAVFAPDALPHVEAWQYAKAGLPDNLDFGVVGEKAQEAYDAALRQEVPQKIAGFFSGAKPSTLNLAGFGVSGALLVLNLLAAAKKWKTRQSPLIGAP